MSGMLGRKVSSVVLEVPCLPPSPNKQRGQHWRRKQAISREVAWAVTAAWARSGRPAHYNRRASIVVTLMHPAPQRDPDNAIASLKELIDALVEIGTLRGDSTSDLQIGSVLFIPSKHKRVLVAIAYIEES